MRVLYLFWVCIVLISPQLKPQTSPVVFQGGELPLSCRMLCLTGDSLAAFYSASSSNITLLYARVSPDNGVTWSARTLIDTLYQQDSPQFLPARLNNSMFAVAYKGLGAYIKFRRTANIAVWPAAAILPTQGSTPAARNANTGFSLAHDGALGMAITHSTFSGGIYIIRSSDAGVTWTSPKQIGWKRSAEPCIAMLPAGRWLMAYRDTLNARSTLFRKMSTDTGATWSDSAVIATTQYPADCPEVIYNAGSSVSLYFQSTSNAAFAGYFNADIFVVRSTDLGASWQAPVRFTKYVGLDSSFVMDKTAAGTSIVFLTDRHSPNAEKTIRHARVTENFDAATPPFLYFYDTRGGTPAKVIAALDAAEPLASVRLITAYLSQNDSVIMYDDGTHGDSLANDKRYTALITPPDSAFVVSASCAAATASGVYVKFRPTGIPLQSGTLSTRLRVFVNRFNLPINNRGILAAVNIYDPNPAISGASGKYDEGIVLFSGGFMMSGYAGTAMWSNGVASASLIEDYVPGKIGIPADDPRNVLFTVRSTDVPFGESWQQWREAVQQGARFYDGNGDARYTPVDLNSNNRWDPTEDRPDLLGDITAWCVYNDGLPSSMRRWNTVSPVGIEVRQSVFGSRAVGNNPFNSSLFVRYTIENKNPSAQRMDSVFFALWADPDIGDFIDDLPGCDSIANAYIAYNKTADNVYGVNCPVVMGKFVQGPPVYIPGVTFQDVNSNGVYDAGVDIPLDTARNNMGTLLGSALYPGAKNARISSAMIYRGGDPIMRDPDNALEVRRYLQGLDRAGNIVNPCTFAYGSVFGVDCNQVNKRLLFSGDPVTNTGWICTSPTDVRNIVTVGPFTLDYKKPVDIISALIIGRGTTSLNSVTTAREYSAAIDNVYRKNFAAMPVAVENEASPFPMDYVLENLYPNPFNPTAVIAFSLPVPQRVTIGIFDMLGRRIAVLMDEHKGAGRHSVTFDGSGLASGVYFYQLRAGSVALTKKCVLLK